MSKSGKSIVQAFQRYKNVLVKALVRLSVKPADVDDILQESLTRALEAKKTRFVFPKVTFSPCRGISFSSNRSGARATSSWK